MKKKLANQLEVVILREGWGLAESSGGLWNAVPYEGKSVLPDVW